jgi:hypothetical protein
LRQCLTEEWNAIFVETVHFNVDGMPWRIPALQLPWWLKPLINMPFDQLAGMWINAMWYENHKILSL